MVFWGELQVVRGEIIAARRSQSMLNAPKRSHFQEKLTDKANVHICGRRYKSKPNIAKLFPYNILHIELIQSSDPEALERRLLTEYVNQYGEAPPLNAI